MNIDQIRAQYPQYNDMSDERLAKALHAKHYSDMDFGEFSSKIGIPERSTWQKTKDAVGGRAEHDFPSASQGDVGLSFMDSLGPATASMFGNDEDFERALKEKLPEAQFQTDKHGNRYFTTPEGKSFYVNEPGLDASDVTRAAGKLGSFVGALSPVGLAKTTMGKVAASGGLSGFADATMQKLAGRDKVDPGQVVTTAAFGSGGEAVGQVLGHLYRAYKNGGRDAALRLADEMGYGNVSDDLLDKIAQTVKLSDDTAPGARIGKAEFDIPYTRAQQLDDASMKSAESRVRNTSGSRRWDEFDQSQSEAIENAVERMAPTGKGMDQSAVNLSEGIKQQQRSAWQNVDDLYGAAKDKKAFIKREALDDLVTRAKQSIQDRTEVGSQAARSLIKDMEDLAGKEGVNAYSFKAIENLRRKAINAAGSSDRAEASAAQQVKKALDGWMDDAVETALFSGDETALEAIKAARKARADYGRIYEPKGDMGTFMKRVVQERSPQEVANYVFGVSGMGRQNAARVAQQVKKAGGPQEVQAMKELAYRRLMENPKTGEALSPKKMITNLKTALQGNQKDLYRELLSPNELSRLSRFAQALDPIISKGMQGRSSGTTERIYRWASEMLQGLPLVGWLPQLKAVGSTSKALRPAVQVPTTPGAGAVGAYTASRQ